MFRVVSNNNKEAVKLTQTIYKNGKIHLDTFSTVKTINLLLNLKNKEEIISNSDLFRGIKIYAVRPPAFHDNPFDETNRGAPWWRTAAYRQNGVEHDGTDYHVNVYPAKFKDRTLQDSGIFREIAYIETKALKDTLSITVPALDTIDTLPALPIDNNTHITLDCINQPIVFNGRMIMSNIRNRLPEAPASFFFKYYKTDPFHNGHSFRDVYDPAESLTWSTNEKKDNIGLVCMYGMTYADDQWNNTIYTANPYPAFWNGTAWVDIVNQTIPFPRFAHNWSCFFEVTLSSEHGTLISRSKVIEFDQCRYQNGKLAFRVNTLFTYPDSRATNVKVYVRDKDANPRQWFYQSFELTKSDTNNYDYAEINTLFYAASEGVAQPSETFDHTMRTDGYTDQNRVQASEPNNPFIFPVKNSYRVGDSGIIRIASVTEALSEGQFGQYPLIAFTQSGIWSLEIGSTVFIERVVPLANELASNEDMIVSINGGIFFATNEGLKVLQGTQVHEISEIVEGPVKNPVANYPGYPIAIKSIEDFKTYLQTASAGYDYNNNEIIISKKDSAYSYVYSFKNQTWMMITDVYDSFLNQFPHNFGYTEHNMHDLSKENENGSKQVSFVTQKFGTHTFTKIIEGALRGQFNDATVQIYGSVDGEQFALLNTRKVVNNHSIFFPRIPYSLKYYILVFLDKSNSQSHIADLEIDFQSRYDHKLR